MAPKTRSQAVKAETLDMEEHQAKPAPKKRARAAPKTSRARKKLCQEDGNADEGRDSSKVFLAASKKGAKSIKETKKYFRNKTIEVTKLIEKQLGNGMPAGEQHFFVERLPSDLASLFPYTVPDVPVGAETRNTVYKKAHECLTHFQTMATDYDAVSKCPTDMRRPAWVLWEKDVKDLRALNQNTLSLAFDALSSIIMPNARYRVAENPAKDDDIGAVAFELLAEAKPNQGEDIWGTVAQGLVRAFSGAVILLPKIGES